MRWIPWAYASIVINYLVLGDFDGVLPGLGATPARRVSMGAHIVLGAVAFPGPESILAGPPSEGAAATVGRAGCTSPYGPHFCLIGFLAVARRSGVVASAVGLEWRLD